MSTRLLQVILQPKFTGSSIVKQKIVYKQNTLDLTDDERIALEASLPEYWHSGKDRLVRFEYYDDMYFCERYRDYFDYKTRETGQKYYKYDVATEDEAQQLYAYILNQYTKIKIGRIENLYEQIAGQVGDLTYVKYSLLESRNELLKDSDFVMMPDYPIDEDTKAKWVTYRQELRDLTAQQAWIDGDLLNVNMPVSPTPKDQLAVFREQIADMSQIPQDLLDAATQEVVDSGSIEDIVRNISQVSVKFELLKGLSRMKLPMLDLDLEVLSQDSDYFDASLYAIKEEVEGESTFPQDWWETATSDVDALIQGINEKLAAYDVSFTINDVLTSVVNTNIERQKEFDALLEEEAE